MLGNQPFTSQELTLMNDADFFHAKAVIMKKIRGLLQTVHDQLKMEVAGASLLTPAQFNSANCQFVKGEHLEYCPYQYVDYPKHFLGGNILSFRSLFWWGHHVVFALMLEGAHLKQYKRNLIDRFHEVAGRNLELSLAPSLWEWKRGEGYTMPLTHESKPRVGAVIAERSFLKITRFIPLTDLGSSAHDLPAVGCQTFRSILPIVSPA